MGFFSSSDVLTGKVAGKDLLVGHDVPAPYFTRSLHIHSFNIQEPPFPKHLICLSLNVPVITGGAMGMGREFAILLATAGVHLALCDVNEVELENCKQLAQVASRFVLAACNELL